MEERQSNSGQGGFGNSGRFRSRRFSDSGESRGDSSGRSFGGGGRRFSSNNARSGSFGGGGRSRSGFRGGEGNRGGFRGGFRNSQRGDGSGFGGGHRSGGERRFDSRGGFGNRREFDREREMHKAVCAECKKDCTVPFKPTQGKPVFCSDCFKKKREQEE